MKKYLLLIVIILFSVSSCRDEEDIPLCAPGGVAPICHGIVRTSEIGQVLGIIGNPDRDRSSSASISVSAYPNPFASAFRVNLVMPNGSSHVKMWTVRCNASDAIWDALMVNGALYTKPTGLAHAVYLDGILPVGIHSVVVEFNDSLTYTPTGFYRLYVEDEENLVWTDICYYK